MEQQARGTKAVFASWLSTNKKMTYTKYTGLAIEKKLEIQKEYKGRRAKSSAIVVESSVEGTTQE